MVLSTTWLMAPFYLLLFFSLASAGPAVYYLEPHVGSVCGETRITIHGEGFASDQFNFGDGRDHLGNRVVLIGSTRTYEGEVHKDGSLETQIMFYTPPDLKHGEITHIQVYVDGVLLQDAQMCSNNPKGYNCRFTARNEDTPTIRTLQPQSGLPGAVVKMTGTIFTNLYESTEEEASNGRVEKILRSYFNGQLCDLKDRTSVNGDTSYGLYLDDDGESTNGGLSCKITGTFVGNQNGSYLVSGQLGRSCVDSDVYFVASNGQISMFQSYAEIKGVYPTSGSSEGGTMLTISGRHFDETNTPAMVKIAGSNCQVLSLEDEEIICVTESGDTNEMTSFPGSRGVTMEAWNDTTLLWNDLPLISDITDSPSLERDLDIMSWEEEDMDDYQTRTRSFFVPPSDNEYTLYFTKCDDDAVLFFSQDGAAENKVQVAECSNPKSDKMYLEGGKAYYMEVVHIEGTERASFEVSAKIHNTRYTHSHLGAATNEQQVLQMTSVVISEKQRVSLVNWTTSGVSPRSEVQEITVTSDQPSEVKYRLGLHGVYTDRLSGASTLPEVSSALSSLPLWTSSETVTAIVNPISGGFTITVTFSASSGGLDLMKAVEDTENLVNVTFSSRRVTEGFSDLDYRLSFDGIPSPLIAADSDASQVQEALQSLFSVRCPASLTTPPQAAYTQDFEENNGLSAGSRTRQKQPFCGHWSSLNPWHIYRQVDEESVYDIFIFNMLCFAYHSDIGEIRNKLYIHYFYDSPEAEVENTYFADTFDESHGINYETPSSTGWAYTCVDMKSLILTRHPDIRNAFLRQITIYKHDSDTMLVDNIAIFRGSMADFPKGAAEFTTLGPSEWIVEDVVVEGNVADGYDITLTSIDCAADLDVITVYNLQAVNSTSDTAVYHEEDWAVDTHITVDRLAASSGPVMGTFTVSYQGWTSSALPVYLTAEEMKAALETSPTMGTVSVYKSGNCVSYTHTIEWLTEAGDHPLIEVNYVDLSGPSVVMNVIEVEGGGLWLRPIRGDALRHVYTVPQVEVEINTIPSKCTGVCSFTWSEASTPVISAITPASGSLADNTILTIDGTGFEDSNENNTVTIGGIECEVISSTTTEIQCRIGAGPPGSHKVQIHVHPWGYAKHDAQDFYFNYLFYVDDVNPTEGSTSGGTMLTLSGTGFGSGVEVLIESQPCEITSFNYTDLVCTTSAMDSEIVANVIVSDGNFTSTSSDTFSYSSSHTLVITSLNITEASVAGGTSALIEVTGLTGDSGEIRVFIGDQEAVVVDQAAGQVTAVLPGMPPGKHTLKLHASNWGYADTASDGLTYVSYILAVNEVCPRTGSFLGGSVITITGTGFTELTEDSNEVFVGETKCDISSSGDGAIVCTVGNRWETHHVDNTGNHPDLGTGYQWHPQMLDIMEGDSVTWEWSAPDVEGVSYRIYETEGIGSMAPMTNGFRNVEDEMPYGHYTYTFTRPGDYFYSGGNVLGDDQFRMLGSVRVHQQEGTMTPVRVTVNGFEAAYSVPAEESTVCTTPSHVDTCEQERNTSLSYDHSANEFQFHFTPCHTPFVSRIMSTTTALDEEIIIEGHGFSDVASDNQVTFGGWPCSVTSVNQSLITCLVDHQMEAGVLIPQPITVIVYNSGEALIKIHQPSQRAVTFLPSVESVTPSEGSVAGGTRLTIKGKGFGNDVDRAVVSLDGYECGIEQLSYDEITCITNKARELSVQVAVTVAVVDYDMSGEALIVTGEAICVGDCSFNFIEAATPELYSVEPNVISTETQLEINGSLFQDVVSVTIGSTPCSVTNVNTNMITCSTGGLRVGANEVMVHISDLGNARSDGVTVTLTPTINSVTPGEGSINGGTELSISGIGFDVESTYVSIGSGACQVTHVTSTDITCLTPASASGETEEDILIVSNSISYPSALFNYFTSYTPTVTDVSPDTGREGDTVAITGTLFGSDTNKVTVKVGGTDCLVTGVSSTSITCDIGQHAAGTFDVEVHINNLGAASASGVTFTYVFAASTITPNTGSLGGGQTVVISGDGFSHSTQVYICGEMCTTIGDITVTELTCSTPSSIDELTVCDVDVVDTFTNATITNGYTYDMTKTANITSVSPARGGTAGGTRLTIEGTAFGFDMNAVDVSIDGSECTIETISDTEIVCLTGEHKQSVDTSVTVDINGDGDAWKTDAEFQYVDVWSSEFSWNYTMPKEGDLVIIPSGMTILLDTKTPILKMLLIQGGKLIFDDEQASVELHARYILITDGGLLQVGTEEEPYQNQALIMLHGHPHQKELPIYGTKNIAVREGTLDLHGRPMAVTWTCLAETVSASDTTLKLQTPVNWSAGDHIVIASTGDHLSQNQNEEREIADVSADGKTLTLTGPLNFPHLGEIMDLGGGHRLEACAEVGLLTRNVVVRGSDNKQWNDTIEACSEGFDTGEFATQTCFQGRFGEEIGSDQFGAHIIIHSAAKDEDLAVGRIENIEMTYAGQAFRLGRYAIHFHLLGKTEKSYVRGCAIHHTFNRAINIHGTHGVTVYNNVVYNIMGGAIFLEDGVETNNIFEQNLAVFVIASSSLQNDDITPAAFWVTNPNNIVRNNAAAGGTHFGFWYRMHEHPDGPSADTSICPRNVPLGEFSNNTVHSQGWFGLWIFKKYTPMVGGGCNSNVPEPAKFYSLTAWNCEKGAEWVDGGALQFREFLLVQDQVAGMDLKLVSHAELWTENGAMVADSVIAAKAVDQSALDEDQTKTGILCPFGLGLTINNTIFIGFDTDPTSVFGVTKIDGKTSVFNGGFTYYVSGATFINSPNKARYQWEHEAVYFDVDGSLTGNAGYSAVATADFLPPGCTDNAEFSVQMPGSVCPDGFHRFAFNHALPQSLTGKEAAFTNTHGTSTAPFLFKASTHKLGWMALLPDGYDYKLDFVNAEHITNISYQGMMYDFKTDDSIIITHNTTQEPDQVVIMPGVIVNSSQDPLTYNQNDNGDWYYNDYSGFSYIVSGKDIPADGRTNRGLDLDVYQCFYKDCFSPDTIDAPEKVKPTNFSVWSDPDTWDFTEQGWGGYNGALPIEDQNVKIPSGVWMVLDVSPPSLGEIHIYGVLEVEPGLIGSLRASHILVFGSLIVGSEDEPFTGDFSFIMRGSHQTNEIVLPDGPVVGAKAIGVFGSMELHGEATDVQWSHLAEPANAGSSEIILDRAVDWQPGNQIVIAPTNFEALETEVRTIVRVLNETITLDSPLTYYHEATRESVKPGTEFVLSAEVGLLSRNIRVIGEAYGSQSSEAFGARVIVGSFFNDGEFLKGFARISNVEFDRTGQEGFTDNYDPRFSVAFVGLGEITASNPCYVRECAFHDGFSPAIGVFGTNYMDVTDNVIHNTVGSAIQIGGTGNRAAYNLVTKVLYPGAYNGRFESIRLTWDAGIETIGASNTFIIGNVVAGSQRTGFRVGAEGCDTDGEWYGNLAHSTLIGVMILPGDVSSISSCSRLNRFTVYRNADFGVYFQTSHSMEIVELLAIDNGLSVFPMIIRPPSAGHEYANKYVEIRGSTIVGRSSSFVCDSKPLENNNYILSDNGRSWTSPNGGAVGISFASFLSGSNNAPLKPFTPSMTYNAIRGHMRIKSVTFSNFAVSCGKNDYILTSNLKVEDTQHPADISDVSLYNVLINNKIWIPRANVGKVNPSDCVDMECDGQKKILLHDIDGTFLEDGPGSIIPQSEFEWGGDPRRGLGDYRIPKTLLTELNGDRIDVNNIAPNKGIVRNGDTCEWRDSYQAYYCPDYVYKMLMLESMDSDTETRRVSPVAVLADGYLDLVNGPEDHGWCSGYTCQKRVSLFSILVVLDMEHKIYMTGTTPQTLRLHLLNAAPDEAAVVGIFYERPWRLDVHVNGAYIMPNNGYMQNDQLLLREFTSREYVPDPATDITGANFFDDNYSELWVLVKGSDPVVISTSSVITLSFDLPGVTADEFFDTENIRRNLALFLDIPVENIIVAQAVTANTRRRRAADVLSIIVTIVDQPSNYTVVDATLDAIEDANLVFERIVTGLQFGSLAEALNLTISNMAVTAPPPPPGSNAWEVLVQMEGEVESMTILIPDHLIIIQQPIEEMEQEQFIMKPMIRVVDLNGEHITLLGSDVYPWRAEVTIRATADGNPSAQIIGNTTVDFVNGWANFPNLMINLNGTYILDFNVIFPAEASDFIISSQEVTVILKQVEAHVVEQPTSVAVNSSFDVVVDLLNAVTGNTIEDIAWRGHTWTCTAELYISGTDAVLGGSALTTTMDPVTGVGNFSGLTISETGRCFLRLLITSDPPEYDLEIISSQIEVPEEDYMEPVIEEERLVQITFLEDFSLVSGKEHLFTAVMYNSMLSGYSNVMFSFVSVTEGSILVDFTIGGTSDHIDSTLDSIWLSLQSGYTLTFEGNQLVAHSVLIVDGETYGGSKLQIFDDDDLSVTVIIVVAVLCTLFVITAIIVVFCIFASKKGKKRVKDIPENDKDNDFTFHGDLQQTVPPLYERKPEKRVICSTPPLNGRLIRVTPSPRPTDDHADRW